MDKRAKGGRPRGTTQEEQRLCEQAKFSAKNDIMALIMEELKKLSKGKRLPKEMFDKVINNVQTKRNLPLSFDVQAKII